MPRSRPQAVGWDIGGANLKAARILGEEIRTHIMPFEIWRCLDRLPQALRSMAAALGVEDRQPAAVTMTAELADIFRTKREGVRRVLKLFWKAFPHTPTWVFAVDGRFLSVEQAIAEPLLVASANWAAEALWVGQRCPNGILIDVGSTTTDILPIVDGRPAVVGRTDPERLQSGELVYTGALRTPVCAVVQEVPWRGGRCRVCAEHFAIVADAYLWLGRISEAEYTCATPDGRAARRPEAAERLARVIGGDREMLTDPEITEIAQAVERAQVAKIADGLRQVVDRLDRALPVLPAGVGAFLARAAARAVGLPVVSPPYGDAVLRAGPAAAVAALLASTLSGSNPFTL
jgi:probable H4MPT-linked C1 transfer pathway protein